MSLEVVKPGPLSLIQDCGRLGHQHQGITTGGPMDDHAFGWANWLLGNPSASAQIEVTLGMTDFLFHQPSIIAITGADLGASLNDYPVKIWRTLAIKKGDRLRFSRPVQGLRAYLAIQGGFQVTPVLGSCATVTRESLGGLNGDGQKLKEGDLVPYPVSQAGSESGHTAPLAIVPKWAIPDYKQPLRLGLLACYQFNWFSQQDRDRFFNSTYTVSQHSDRMGYRLTGPEINAENRNIISEGIAYGSVQVPPDGQPIVLLKDRQTIGGYPKLGTLTALGAGQLAQRMPGTEIQFYLLDINEAEAEQRLFQRALGNG